MNILVEVEAEDPCIVGLVSASNRVDRDQTCQKSSQIWVYAIIEWLQSRER